MESTDPIAIRAIRSVRRIFSALTEKQRRYVLSALRRAPELDAAAREERKRILDMLSACENNMERTAAALGFSRRTLQNHMRALDIPPVKYGRPIGS